MDTPFYFILLLHSLPPPGLLHTTVCVMLRSWSEGSRPQVLLHTCDSGKEIPEPLLLVLPHLTPSPVFEGSVVHLLKNALESSSLTFDLAPWLTLIWNPMKNCVKPGSHGFYKCHGFPLQMQKCPRTSPPVLPFPVPDRQGW